MNIIKKIIFTFCLSVFTLSMALAQEGPGFQDFVKAESERQNSRRDIAVAFYKKAIAKEPKNSKYVFSKALCELEMGAKRDAIKSLEKVTELDPKHTDAYEMLGDLYAVNRKTVDNAVSAYQKAYEQAANDDTKLVCKLKIIVLLDERKLMKTAGPHIADLKKIDPENVDIYYYEAKQSIETGNYKQAIKDMELVTSKITSSSPVWNAKYWFELGRAYHLDKQYVKANDILQNKANYYPYKSSVFQMSDDFYYKLARAYEKIYDNEKANEFLTICLTINPKHEKGIELQKKIKLAETPASKLAELIKIQKNAIKTETDSKERRDKYDELAKLQFKAAQYEEAVESADQVILSNPRAMSTIYLKAICLSKMNQDNQAVRLLEGISKSPDLPSSIKGQILFTMGIMYSKLGLQQSAYTQFKRLKRSSTYKYPSIHAISQLSEVND